MKDFIVNVLSSLIYEGYTLEYGTIKLQVITSSNSSESILWQFKNGCDTGERYIISKLLFFKTIVFDDYYENPVYTKRYNLFSIQIACHEQDSTFSSLTYDTRQLLVPGGEIRKNLLGLRTGNILLGQASDEIYTDRSDHEIVLLTLSNPRYPLIAIPVELFDIFSQYMCYFSLRISSNCGQYHLLVCKPK